MCKFFVFCWASFGCLFGLTVASKARPLFPPTVSSWPLSVATAPSISSIVPARGPVGTIITITGTDLTGAVEVLFNGVSQPTFTSNSATEIKLAVPAGATTGQVVVKTAAGSSAGSPFTVGPAPAPVILLTAAELKKAVRQGIEDFATANDDTHVATVHFPNLKIPVTAGRELVRVRLDSIEFDVQAGRITQLYAYSHAETKDSALKIFANARTSISLMRYDKHREDVLGLYNSTVKDEYMKLGDLFYVLYKSGRRFMPADGPHKLVLEKKVALGKPNPNLVLLSAGAALSSLMDVSLYTDLLGLLNKESNSLVSLELASEIPLNTEPLVANWSLFAFQHIRPYGSLSRYDSKADTVLLQGTKFDSVNRAALLQQAYFRYGANLNLLTFSSRSPHSFALNGGWSGTITRVTDGRKGTNGVAEVRNAYSKTWNLEAVASFRRLGNFGVDIGANLLFNHVSNSGLISNDGYRRIIKPSALVYFHPQNAPNNRIFLRLSSWSFLEDSDHNFFQAQVGYQIGIGSVTKALGLETPQTAANRASGSPL